MCIILLLALDVRQIFLGRLIRYMALLAALHCLASTYMIHVFIRIPTLASAAGLGNASPIDLALHSFPFYFSRAPLSSPQKLSTLLAIGSNTRQRVCFTFLSSGDSLSTSIVFEPGWTRVAYIILSRELSRTSFVQEQTLATNTAPLRSVAVFKFSVALQ